VEEFAEIGVGSDEGSGDLMASAGIPKSGGEEVDDE
jgi:hypothetical protein